MHIKLYSKCDIGSSVFLLQFHRVYLSIVQSNEDHMVVKNKGFTGTEHCPKCKQLLPNIFISILICMLVVQYIIGILRGYVIRPGRRPEGSQRPQYSFYPV